MNQFQKIKFRVIHEFLDYLPEHELSIVQELRSIVLGLLPNPKEKLLYNEPFFLQRSRICFIWPSSVPLGKVKLNGIQLGFPKGYLMIDEIDFLEEGGRKQVYTKTFFTLDEIETDMVKTYVLEAPKIDGIKP